MRRLTLIALALCLSLACSSSDDPADNQDENNQTANNQTANNQSPDEGDPELDDRAGTLTIDDGIPRREGGDDAILTDTSYGDEFDATITLDPDAIAGEPISHRLGSINMETQFNGFNTVDAAGDLNPDVVDRLQQLHLDGRTIRWPGGGYDELDYGECIGPVDDRGPQSFFDGDPEPCTFGPAEADALAQQLGAELWMQVQPMLVDDPDGDDPIDHGVVPVANHNSGDPDTIDRPVTHWQLGNEQYHYDPDDYPVSQYIEQAQALADVMVDIDPDILLWAPVQENYSLNFFSAQPQWTPTVLDELGERLHGLTIHNGYAPVAPEADDADAVRDAYKAMFSNALWAEDNLMTIDQLAQDAGQNHLRYAITEANASFGILPDQHNLMNHTQTMASAAYMATMLNTYTRHPRVDHVHLFTGVQFTSQGLIGVTDGDFSSTPDTFSATGLLLHLWNQLPDAHVVPGGDVDAPTFNAPEAGWMEARDDIPLVDALPLRHGDDGLELIVINRSLDDSARLHLQLQGRDAIAIDAQALLGRAPDSNPGLTIPDVTNPTDPAVLEAFDDGQPGEVWIRSESTDDPSSIRLPRSSVTFLSITLES